MSTAVSLMRAVSGSSPYCLRLPIFDAGSSWPPRHASSPSPWPCDGNESRFLHCWRTSLVRIILMDDVHLKRNDGKTTVSCRAIGALPCRLDTCMEIKILRRDPSTRRLLDGAAVLLISTQLYTLSIQLRQYRPRRPTPSCAFCPYGKASLITARGRSVIWETYLIWPRRVTPSKQ